MFKRIADQASRFFVGGLFIFSGLIKLNDPIGTRIKMEEYFGVFAEDFGSFFSAFVPYAMEIGMIMIILEIVLGVAVLIPQLTHLRAGELAESDVQTLIAACTPCSAESSSTSSVNCSVTTDAQGRRPSLAPAPGAVADPPAGDRVLFHEYFDGDTGRGLGASHQTGWTGLVANLLQKRGWRRGG